MGIIGSSGGSSSDPNAAVYADLGNRVKLITSTNSWLANSPDLIYQMASDASVATPDLVNHAGQLAGMINMSALHDRLNQLAPATQRAVYGQLTESQQNALGQLGYSTPDTAAGNSSGASGLFGHIANAIGDVTGAVGSAIGTVASPVLSTLTKVADQPEHLYRTLRTMDLGSQLAGFGGALLAGGLIAAGDYTDGLGLGATTALSAIGGLAAGNATAAVYSKVTNGTDWWDAFNHAWNGERTFTAESQMQAKNLLQGNASIANLAKDIANAGGLPDISSKIDAGNLAADFASVRNSTDGNTMLASVTRVVNGLVDPNDPRYNDLLNKISVVAQDPQFRQAVATLQNGKISMGRDLARTVGLAPGSSAYNVVSGATDGLAVVTLDPFITIGALNEARLLSRFAVPEELLGNATETARWVNEFVDGNKTASANRDLLAEAVNTGDFSKVKAALPATQSQWYDLLKYKQSLIDSGKIAEGGFDARAIADWNTEGGGLTALLQGKSSRLDAAHIIMANTSPVGQQWARVKQWSKAVIDMADDNNSTRIMRSVVDDNNAADMALRVDQTAAMPDVVTASTPGYARAATADIGAAYPKTQAVLDFIDRVPVIKTAERQIGALLGSLTTASPSGSFLIAGAGADAADVNRFTSLGRVVGMNHDVTNSWANFITSQTNPALRASGIESFIDTMLKFGGSDVTPEARDLAARFIGKSHQVFGLGGVDTLALGGTVQRLGVAPVADMSYEMAVPNLKALRQAVQKGSFLHYVFDAGDLGAVDTAVTKIWKPSVLMRLGFIPRVASDELLSFFAREGMSGYFTGLAERGIAKGKLLEPGVARQTLIDAGKTEGYADAFLGSQDYADAIKHWQVIAPYRPLEQILGKYDYAQPIVKIMEQHSAWLRQTLENGVLPDRLVDAMPDAVKDIVIGRPGTLRNLLLNGVDPDRLRAGMIFQTKFASSIMNEAAATSAGLLDTGVRNGRLATIAAPNPKDPYSLVDRPLVLDERKYFYQRQGIDKEYANGVHSSMQHLLSDTVYSEAAGQVLPRLIPGAMQYSEARGMSRLYADVAPGPVRDALGLALNGKPLTADHFDSWLDSVPASARQLAALAVPGAGATGKDLLTNLRTYDVGDPGELDSALALVKKLESLPPNERAWATMYLPHRVMLDPNLGQDYFLTYEQAQQQMLDHIRAGVLNPEHQPYLQLSRHGIEDPEGNVVAKPLTGPRTYMPSMHSSNATALTQALTNSTEVQSMLQGGASLEDAVATALKERHLSLVNLMDRSPTGLAAGRDWIDQFAARHFGTEGGDLAGYVNDAVAGTPDYVMLPGNLGLHDPRVASDMTRTLQSFITPGEESIANGSGVSFLDLGHGDTRWIGNDPLTINGRVAQVPTGSSQYHVVTPQAEDVLHRLAEMRDNFAYGATDSVVKEGLPHWVNGDEAVSITQDLVNVAKTQPLSKAEANMIEEIQHHLDIAKKGTAGGAVGTQWENAPFNTEWNPGTDWLVQNGLVYNHATYIAARDQMAQFENLVSLVERRNQVVHGVSLEDSVDKWSKLQLERFNQLTTEGVRTTMTPAAEPLYERVVRNGKSDFRVVQPGEPILLNPDAQYYTKAKIADESATATGPAAAVKARIEKLTAKTGGDIPEGMTQIKFGDPRFMTTTQTVNGDRYLWDQVGPALRDALDETRGLARYGPNGNRLFNYSPDDVGAATGQLPNIVFAPAAVSVQPGGWQRAVNGWFDKVVGPSLDAIVRRPIAYHNFVDAYQLATKAQSFLRDGTLLDETLPRLFGKSWNAGFLDEDAKAEIANTIRSTAKYFDHPVSTLSDNEALGYFRSIDAGAIDKAKARLLNDAQVASPSAGRAIEDDLAGLRQMSALKKVNPDAITASLNGVDRNVEAARSLIDQAGSALAKPWARAQTDQRVIDMIDANPGLARGFANGGWEQLQMAKANLASIDDRVTEIATQRAVINTVPFIHNAEMKSQFADYGKPLMPFWYAQEKFFKRWGQTLLLEPEAIRKAQLAYMGLHSTGLVRTDAQGKDWFIYPGSKLLTDALGKVPGLGVLPVGSAFQAPTSSMLPGFGAQMGAPSFSPFVTLPLATVTGLFPELKPVDEAIGGVGAKLGVARQFIPGQIMNLWTAAFANDNTSQKFSSAMMSAAAMMEANGQGLKPEATTDDIDNYLRTLRTHARTIMVAQALMGFVSPGAPSEVDTGDTGGPLSIGATDPGRQLRDEFLQLVRYQGVQEGTQSFLAEHGDKASPEYLVNPEAYTVGLSKSASGAPLPATAGAVQFFDDNRDWMAQFPEAGPWLLPNDPKAKNAFELDAYTTQTIDGLRIRQTPAEFLTSIKFKEGASGYFRAKDEYQAAVDQANANKDANARRVADVAWTNFSDAYKVTHPVFAEQLTTNSAGDRRTKTIAQMRTALNDPLAPHPPQFDDLKTMMSDYDFFNARLADLSASRSAADKQASDDLKSQYAQFMDSFVFSHPDVESFWTSVLKPTVSIPTVGA